MYLDRSTLRTSLVGLVGSYQTVNPEYPTLAASLLVSRSGRYWSEEHALLSIENIDQCVKNFAHYPYEDYDNATTYSLYDKVVYNSVNYEYINATSASGNLPTDEDYWAVIDELSDYLTKIDYKATDLTIDSIMNAKKLRGEVKSIFNNVQLYNGHGNLSDTVTNDGSFVGLMIKVREYRSLIAIIHKVGHQFDGALASKALYLFHTSQQTAIATFTFSQVAANNTEWLTLSSDNIIRYLSDDYDTGGYFMLGYFQDDLGAVKAIKKRIDWDIYKACCDVKHDYRKYSPYISVSGFKVSSSYLNGTSLPDLGADPDAFQDRYNNYGLNLQFTSKCDLTPFILQQEELLAEVKSLNIAYLLLQEMAYSTRDNSLSIQVKEQAKKELYSFKDAFGTVMDRLTKATKSLDFDLSGLDEPCLPNKSVMSVTYESA